MPARPVSFLDHLYFQIIKLDGIDKAVLIETGFGMAFELVDRDVEPDRLAQIKLVTDLIQRVKYLMCAGVVRLIAYYDVAEHPVVFKFFSP